MTCAQLRGRMGIWVRKKTRGVRPGHPACAADAMTHRYDRGDFSLSGHRLPSLYRDSEDATEVLRTG